MGQAPLRCEKPGARVIYDHLVRLEKGGALPKGLNLDAGWHKLNYRDVSNPKGEWVGKNDGEVSCEEVWENGLEVLSSIIRHSAD